MGPKLCMSTQAMVLLALFSIHPHLFFVLQVSLNKDPAQIGLFSNVLDVRVPIDGFVDCYS